MPRPGGVGEHSTAGAFAHPPSVPVSPIIEARDRAVAAALAAAVPLTVFTARDARSGAGSTRTWATPVPPSG